MVTQSQFVAWGLTKDQWPNITPALIQTYLDNPYLLDKHLEWTVFIEAFYYYHDWWFDNQRRDGKLVVVKYNR
jgi:hypothetical protein